MSPSESNENRVFHEARELLAAALAGSGASLGDLLDRHRNYLILLATPQLVGPGRKRCSESDIVQETFLEAHRDFAAFRGTTLPQFQAWLRRILSNNILTFLERHVWAEKRDVRREQSLHTVAEGLDCSAINLESFVAGSTDSPSECAMRRLPRAGGCDRIPARRLSGDYHPPDISGPLIRRGGSQHGPHGRGPADAVDAGAGIGARETR